MVSYYSKELKWLVLSSFNFIILVFTLVALLFVFVRLLHRYNIVGVFFFILLAIPVILDKVKRTFAYDIVQKTFVQAIRQLHCSVLFGLTEITSVWKFDVRRRFLKVNISYGNTLDAQNSLGSALGVPDILLLDWIEFCIIAHYTTCLGYVSAFLQFVQRSVPIYNIIYMCFVVVCHNFSIPVF